MNSTKYRYFVQTVGTVDILFRWNPESERMEIHSLDDRGWRPDPSDATPSTRNEMCPNPENTFYIHEIDESIVNYKLREAGL